MKPERFLELADKFDTFYAYYKKANEVGKKTYMVCTHNLNTKHIKAELEKAPQYIKEMVKSPKPGYVALYSYTQSRFRVMPTDAFTRLSMLSVELDKQERTSGYKR